ncbi:ABC transporter ATP-binding protein [Burkholderia pyrrocinia]|nr:ABC transporter ATP-binding protein [Burkholderia pyrrocinia]
MLRTFIQLLGDDAPVFRRYLAMAAVYGLLSGLTITALMPVVTHLLSGATASAAAWLAVLFAGVALCWQLRQRVERAGMAVGSSLLLTARQRIGDHVASLPVGWFTPDNTARLSQIVSHGMMEVAQLPAHLFTPVISGAMVPLVLAIALLALHWQIGLIALAALPVIAGVFLVTARFGARTDAAFHAASADMSQRMVEFAQAQSVLRAFSGEGAATRFLERAIERQRRSGTRLIGVSTASVMLNAWAVQGVFAILIVCAMLWLDVLPDVASNAGAAAAFVVALLLINRFVDPLMDVGSYVEALRGVRGRLDAIADIFAVEPLPEPHRPHAPRDGSVELQDVGFAYAPDQADVLHGVSLHVPAGTMTALVGASGSGKTTVARLIARFFDVTHGAVMVGGIDVRHMSSAQLSGQISQIFQSAYLFQGSIADNIRIGKPDATDAEVMEAATQAGVAEIIARLPQGLNTPVGEGGARLSGGERQRIAIARALIKDAPILLVDEATAALDPENQAAISDALARLRGKRTLIVIAHQLSTVAMADQIVVLDDGRIAERGTHAQLRAAGGRYARFLAQRQAAKGWRIV